MSSALEFRQVQILEAVQGTPVLTIGENLRQFGTRGGIINFMLFQGPTRFAVNFGAARQHGLEVSCASWLAS